MYRLLIYSLFLISTGSAPLAGEIADSLLVEKAQRTDTMYVIPAGPVAGSFTTDCRMQVVDTVAGWAKVQVEGWVPVGLVMDRIESVNNYNSSNNIATPADKVVKQRCAAITKKGTRCSRAAQSGSKYCWQHQKGN
jgi:hypothetical protein